eukprot:308997_1
MPNIAEFSVDLNEFVTHKTALVFRSMRGSKSSLTAAACANTIHGLSSLWCWYRELKVIDLAVNAVQSWTSDSNILCHLYRLIALQLETLSITVSVRDSFRNVLEPFVRKDNGQKMVECGKCMIWFCKDCMKISDNEWANQDFMDDWICPSCKKQ